MEKKEEFKEVVQLLQMKRRDDFAICHLLYPAIINSVNPVACFRWLATEGFELEGEEPCDNVLTEEQVRDLSQNCEGLTDSILSCLLRQNLSEDDFYIKLLQQIKDNTLFLNEKERGYALVSLYTDARLPYFSLAPLKIWDKQEVQNTINMQKKVLEKIAFIMSLTHLRHVERAMYIEREISQCTSEIERSLILSIVLTLMERRIMENNS